MGGMLVTALVCSLLQGYLLRGDLQLRRQMHSPCTSQLPGYVQAAQDQSSSGMELQTE